MWRPVFIAEQSRRPTGFLGRLIGYIMSAETAAVNAEALTLLDLQPSDGVLEVGSGHGRTLERAASALGSGSIAGVDVSEEMVRMATHRCRRLIGEGKVSVSVGSSDNLPFEAQHFDKALAVHTLYFWSDPGAHLREIRRVLRDDGRLVLVFRSRDDERTRNFPSTVYRFYTADEVAALLKSSGFPRVDLGRTTEGFVAASASR
jgi:ubiquinone/menaquinone biosynthesis C-methylase UbiE